MKKTFALVAAGLAFCAGSAHATILYTVRTSGAVLVKIDTTTWTFTDVGPLGVPYNFGDLAFDANGTLYMVQGFAGTGLYTVDINTGAATLVGTHGFSNMFGLAFDGNGDLWGSQSTTGQGFHRIDKNTGVATFVGNPGVNLDGITWDSQRDMIVGLLAGPGSLHEINRGTGGQTILTSGGGFVDNCGIAYDPSVDLIYCIDWSSNLFSFNPANGYARTTIMRTSGSHDGLAVFNPEVPCYPDCDTSTGRGVLDIFDFLCFQNRYDAGSPYACDCDTTTGPGVCDIFDFLCFQNAYDAGCP